MVHHTQYHRILPTGRHLNIALHLKTYKFLVKPENLCTCASPEVTHSFKPTPHFDNTYLVMQQRALSVFKKGAALRF